MQTYAKTPPWTTAAAIPPGGVPARDYTGDAVKVARSASKLIMEHVARAQQATKLSDAAVGRLIGCGQSNISTLHHGSTMSADLARRLNCVFPFPDSDYLVSQLPRDSKPCTGKPTHPVVIDYVDRRAAWDAEHKDVALPIVSSTATEAAPVKLAKLDKLTKTTKRTLRQARRETKRVGELLNSVLAVRKLTCAQAAKEIGVSYDAVRDCSRIGAGKLGRRCRVSTLTAISEWLGCVVNTKAVAQPADTKAKPVNAVQTKVAPAAPQAKQVLPPGAVFVYDALAHVVSGSPGMKAAMITRVEDGSFDVTMTVNVPAK
jgi:hypothetical protein